MPKIGSHFVGQKRNKVNRVSLTIQYLNQVFDYKEQLVNIDIVYLFSFDYDYDCDTGLRLRSLYTRSITYI